MSPAEDQWICRTTTGCVAVLGLIAGMVSYLHMHLLVELHGQPEWVAALTPLSVDGMIVAASTMLLPDSRAGQHGGMLPKALLVAGNAQIVRYLTHWWSAVSASRTMRAGRNRRLGHDGSVRSSLG